MPANQDRPLYLPPDTIDRLAARAAAEGRSIEDLLADAIRLLPPVADSGSRPGPAAEREPGYWGFISYSHADKAVAVWLHRALERFRVPRAFVGRQAPAGRVGKYVKPFFRDQDEFAASADLGERINRALDASRFLIVVCSPASARSRWVNQEIARFRLTATGSERVLCLIASGEPNASAAGRPEQECFPPALFTTLETTRGRLEGLEPIAADIRPGHDTHRRATIRLVAAMIEVGFDALWRRDRRRWRQQLAAGTAAVALTLGAIGFSGYRARRANLEAAQSNERARAAREQARIADKESRISALTAAYESESDSLVKVQLAAEMPDDAETPQRLGWLHEVTQLRPPLVEYTGTSRFAAFSPDGTTVLTASDQEARLSTVNGVGRVASLARQGPIWDAIFTPDGRSVLTASGDGAIRLWDPKTAGLQKTLSGHTSAVYKLAISADSRLLVSGSHDQTARIWRLDGIAEPIVLRGHHGGVGMVAISPDASLVATGSSEIGDHTVKVWRADGTPLRDLPHGAYIRRLAFSPDGSRLLSVSDDTHVHVWTVSDWSDRVIDGSGVDADFSPDGTRVVTSFTDVRIHDLAADTRPTIFEPRAGTTRFVRFSPDGSKVVAASDDGQLRVWPVDRPWDVIELNGGTGHPLGQAVFDMHGRVLGSGYAGPARLWDLNASNERIDLPPRSNQRTVGVVNSAEPGAAAVISADGTIVVYSLEGARANQLGLVPGIDASFTDDGSRLLVLGQDGGVTERQLSALETPRSVGGGWSRVVSHASFRKRRTLIVDRGDHAALWRADGAEYALGPVADLEKRGVIESDAVRTAGPVLLARTPGGLSLFNGHDWINLGTPSPVPRAEFDPTGQRAALAGPNLALEIRPVDQPSTATTVKLASQPLESTAIGFSPDGGALAAGLMLGSVRIASLDGKDRLVLRSPRDRIDEVSFSANGRRLVASGGRAGVSVWPLWWADLLRLVRAATTACLSAANRVRLLQEAPADAQAAFTSCEQRHGRPSSPQPVNAP
jgi:WD40 repeat protein